EALQNRLGALVDELSVVLPKYMIPTLIIPCKYMPFTISTKLDRKLLHEQLSSLTWDQRAAYSPSNRIKREPETRMERRLQTIWAEILNVPMDSIGRDDTFFQLGGDSIMGIYLVSTAKEDGIAFTVKDVFDDPRLSAVALKAILIQDGSADITESPLEPFSLLSESRSSLALGDEIREECGLDDGQTIEDAYPCSPLQEGLIALTVKQPGSYVATYVYHLSKLADVSRFKNAWDTVVEVCSNLRTRIVLLDGVTTQVVLDNDSHWQSAENETLDSMTRSLRNAQMGYGTPLCRYTIVSEKGENYFIWVAHHSIYDGWTLKVMFSVLYQAYSDRYIPEIRPFSYFIKYVQETNGDAAASFWETELSGAVRASFPPRPTGPHKAESQCYRSTISFTSSAKTSITHATILRAAWSIVLARYCDSNEAVFGVTV
ncbi:non-ribosomal peptide synthetase, partial [Trichoderma atroviride IMI 206040]